MSSARAAKRSWAAYPVRRTRTWTRPSPPPAGPSTTGRGRASPSRIGSPPWRRSSTACWRARTSSTALLNSSVGAEPQASTEGTILRTQDGLLPSFLPEYRFYPWRRGDTWTAVAARYYADAGGLERLQRANEGRTEVTPGEKILVPVIDLDAAPDATRAPAVPARTTNASTYVVVDGDSLWAIAKKVYGEGSRWEQIFEANRDQLASGDDLRVGQVLRVP